MNMDREFSNVEKDSNKKLQKRHHTSDEEHYKTRFEK